MTESINQYSTPDPIREFNTESALPDSDARQALREDGVVCLRKAHDSGWLSLVEEGIEQALSGGSEDVDIVEKAKDTGRFLIPARRGSRSMPFVELFLIRGRRILLLHCSIQIR